VVLKRKLMTEEELNQALRHEVLTQPRVYEAARRGSTQR
jgi:aspartate ammonia-lyase